MMNLVSQREVLIGSPSTNFHPQLPTFIHIYPHLHLKEKRHYDYSRIASQL